LFLFLLQKNGRNRQLLLNTGRYLLLSISLLTSIPVYSGSEHDELIELHPSLKTLAAKSLPLSLAKTVNAKVPLFDSKIAIIIDDIGYNYAQGLEAIALPGAITYAIIPHSPKASFFAAEARKHQKEIMLHAPMSNVHNIPLGENGLSETMNEVHFKQALNSSLDSLPGVSGVNNHMGSLLTQKSLPMEWVMHALKQRQLYFIDSRTTSNSVAWSVAQNLHIPSLKRDIFLDNIPTAESIDKQFKQLIALAKRRGYAVAIAHPYPETIRYLQQHLPILAQQNINLVFVSALVQLHSPNILSLKNTKSVKPLTKTRVNYD
jgi:polysaccharide deacetylase 2 family uncharacterized protein YibQ